MGNSKVELNVISLLSELSSLFKIIRHHYCKQVSWHWSLSMFVNIQCVCYLSCDCPIGP